MQHLSCGPLLCVICSLGLLVGLKVVTGCRCPAWPRDSAHTPVAPQGEEGASAGRDKTGLTVQGPTCLPQYLAAPV